MTNRLKSFGAQFNRRKKSQDGYGTVGDGDAVTEESPFHWADDNVDDSNEMVTFTETRPLQQNAAAIRREADDLDFPPLSSGGGGDEVVEASTLTGDELIAQSLAEDIQPNKVSYTNTTTLDCMGIFSCYILFSFYHLVIFFSLINVHLGFCSATE
jgi:hypothetical protein